MGNERKAENCISCNKTVTGRHNKQHCPTQICMYSHTRFNQSRAHNWFAPLFSHKLQIVGFLMPQLNRLLWRFVKFQAGTIGLTPRRGGLTWGFMSWCPFCTRNPWQWICRPAWCRKISWQRSVVHNIPRSTADCFNYGINMKTKTSQPVLFWEI